MGCSCRIETSPLICSANQWTGFCRIGTSVMKDSKYSSSQCIIFFLCFSFFFLYVFFHGYSWFTGQQVKRKTMSLYRFYHFHPLQRHSDFSWVITAESSPLGITGIRNRTWNLWYMFFRIHSFCTCTDSWCC